MSILCLHQGTDAVGCICRKLYKQGQFAEAYSCGSAAMKIYSGHERANRFVAEIRDIVCKYSAFCGNAVSIHSHCSDVFQKVFVKHCEVQTRTWFPCHLLRILLAQ